MTDNRNLWYNLVPYSWIEKSASEWDTDSTMHLPFIKARGETLGHRKEWRRLWMKHNDKYIQDVDISLVHMIVQPLIGFQSLLFDILLPFQTKGILLPFPHPSAGILTHVFLALSHPFTEHIRRNPSMAHFLNLLRLARFLLNSVNLLGFVADLLSIEHALCFTPTHCKRQFPFVSRHILTDMIAATCTYARHH